MASGTSRGNDPYPIVELDEIDSTNAEALRRAAAGERGPLWLRAMRQSAGRGRSGRDWQFQEGNLAATLLLEPGCAPDRLPQLSLVTGVAVYDAIRPMLTVGAECVAQLQFRLKWPNDILAGPAKLCGVLIESTIIGEAAVAAIGIGVNVASAPAVSGRPTVALGDIGKAVEASELLGAIDERLQHWLGVWSHGAGFAAIRDAWLARGTETGAQITVTAAGQSFKGAFAGMDETGALLVSSVTRHPEEIRRFTFGDVSFAPDHKSEG